MTQEIDTKNQELELQQIQSNFIQVRDQQSHDVAVDGIRQAAGFIKKIEAFFEPFEKPLKAALDGLRSRKKGLIDPADQYITEHRKRCADWQTAEIKRLNAERVKLLEEMNNNLSPWEEPQELAPVAAPTLSGATVRNKPWQARVVNYDQLWEAAVKYPQYRIFFVVDLKLLNSKARSQQGQFNIPGCEAFQEQTLVVKG